MVVARPEPVTQHECGDPERVQVARDLPSLVVRRQVLVAAARAHDHRRRPGRHRSRQVDGDRGHVRVGSAEGARRAGGPERNHLSILYRHRRWWLRLRWCSEGGDDQEGGNAGGHRKHRERILRHVTVPLQDEFSPPGPRRRAGQHGDEPRRGLRADRRLRAGRPVLARRRRGPPARRDERGSALHVVRRGAARHDARRRLDQHLPRHARDVRHRGDGGRRARVRRETAGRNGRGRAARRGHG